MRDKNVRQLWGKDFDIVEDGLAESQVVGFATDLINERNTLLQHQEHLNSLTKLAEKTVVEADKLAEDIKTKAEEEAKTKASKILAEAEKQAQELMKQKQSEILAAANEEASTIRAAAQQEAELLMAQYKQRLQAEIKEMTQKLHGQLVTELEGLKQQAIALQAEWESKLAEPANGTTLTSDNELPPASIPVNPEQKEEIAPAIVPEINLEDKGAILEQLQKAPADSAATSHPEEQPLTPNHQAVAVSQQPSATSEQADLSTVEEPAPEPAQSEDSITYEERVELDILPPTSEQSDMSTMEKPTPELDQSEDSITYEGEVELDILPPIKPRQLIEIQRYLQGWPGIGITELRPNDGGYSIIATLEKPIQLINILRELPEVEEVRASETSDAEMLIARREGRLRKIIITLPGNNRS